jgi:hypothetical protein
MVSYFLEVAGEQVGQPVDPVDPHLPFPGEVVEPDVAQ